MSQIAHWGNMSVVCYLIAPISIDLLFTALASDLVCMQLITQALPF